MIVQREIGFGHGSSSTQISFKGGIKSPVNNENQVSVLAQDFYKGTRLGMLIHLSEQNIKSLIDFLQNELEN